MVTTFFFEKKLIATFGVSTPLAVIRFLPQDFTTSKTK